MYDVRRTHAFYLCSETIIAEIQISIQWATNYIINQPPLMFFEDDVFHLEDYVKDDIFLAPLNWFFFHLQFHDSLVSMLVLLLGRN